MTVAIQPVSSLFEIEKMPDGRQLHVYQDGSIVVSGRAEIREHPVKGVTWITRVPPQRRARRARAQPALGARGEPVALRVPAEANRSTRTTPSRPTWGANARAHELLLSLLNPFQREEYLHHGGFWVEVARGSVRLGNLYNLEFRPKEAPHKKQFLCVVPVNYQFLPRADIWANLLLVLLHDPEKFFRVAVRRRIR